MKTDHIQITKDMLRCALKELEDEKMRLAMGSILTAKEYLQIYLEDNEFSSSMDSKVVKELKS